MTVHSQSMARPVTAPPGNISRLPLAAICAGYFMVILDTTVVNVALPSLGRGLHTGTTGLQWVVDGYTLVLAGFLLPAGALGDRIGAKRVFQAGGIASGIINAARQVGSVIGIALLGALVARRTTFISGLHVAVIIGGAAFLLGCGLTIAAVGGRRERPTGAGSGASGPIIPSPPASVGSGRDN